MSAYSGDPGGIFASEVHRRVAGHLPVPGDPGAGVSVAHQRFATDGSHGVESIRDDQAEYEAALTELRDDGDVELVPDGTPEAGWRLTEAGFAKLTGPNSFNPPDLQGPALEAALAANQAEQEENEASERKATQARVEELRAELAEAAVLIAPPPPVPVTPPTSLPSAAPAPPPPERGTE